MRGAGLKKKKEERRGRGGKKELAVCMSVSPGYTKVSHSGRERARRRKKEILELDRKMPKKLKKTKQTSS